MAHSNLQELLQSRVLVGDGAMGTALREQGIAHDFPYARANISRPEIVLALHEDYVRAGARVIETNTFAANEVKLSAYNLGHKVWDINVAAARLAAKAAAGADGDCFVVGAIGPLGHPLAPVGAISAAEMTSVFERQAEALVEGEVDALLLETFTDLRELRLAHDAAARFGVPVLAYKTFVEDGETISAGLPYRVAQELSQWGVTLVGSNCTVGPQRMLEIAGQMAAAARSCAAFPNPGLPQRAGRQIRYARSVEHFASYGVRLADAGARLIGGCCGTTPAHIRALAAALRQRPARSVTVRPHVEIRHAATGRAAPPSSHLARSLRDDFAITVELDLPRGTDISTVVTAATRQKECGADAIDISDGARARLRMHPIAAAKIVQDEAGIEVVAHISCRDRNLIGLQADLLGAASLGIKNLLAITGDPVQIGDYPEASSVFDTDSIGLVHAMARMNYGEDLGGNPIGEPPGFLIGVAFNPTAEDLEAEVERLRRKAAAGAHAVWTQPVFEASALETALEAAERALGGGRPPFLVGLMPLRSSRQAEFLHHEVPGIEIPARVRSRLADLDPAGASQFGVETALEVLSRTRSLVQGAYIMPPATAPELAAPIVEAARKDY